jgi:ribosomal protein S18 acetylase RimI-like enzyme
MTVLSPRSFSWPQDYVQVRSLLLANQRMSPQLAILDWCRFISQANAQTLSELRLWVDETGRLVAFVWPDLGGSEIITRANRRTVFELILEWEEAQAAGSTLRLVLDEREQERTALLQRRGYQQARSMSFYSVRSLSERIAAPQLPPGYRFAIVNDLADLESRVATERAAMPWSSTTVATYRALQEMPDYWAGLDRVVLGPAGDVAAFCCFWAETSTRIGVVEPIGCHPAHQRRGLGTALLNEGMQRLRALGMRDVYVGNGPVPETLDTPGPPRRLTASVGFRHLAQKLTWCR